MPDDIPSRLRAMAGPIVPNVCTEAADEIERLRNERDEARRAVCCTALPSDYKEWNPKDVDAALKLIAAQQGWDCFKEAP